ncbi:MAG: hypothetical protein ABL926_01295 [Novosphingobium sp.]|uniref:hypothetical protein n=1 Tax=Novosphingobium sp. TaxID=1874826 RepID=UPI0032B75E95
MNDETLLDLLPIEQRLALAYGARAARGALLTVLALDARLAGVVRAGREPVLVQIKLAWWRENVSECGLRPVSGQPLLARIAANLPDPAVPIGLIDAWEGMLGEGPISSEAIGALAQARAMTLAAAGARFAEGAKGDDIARAGRNWALADLAARLSQADERGAATALAARQDWRRPVLPPALRALAVLHGLARRRHDGRPLLADKRAFAVALRLGLLNV